MRPPDTPLAALDQTMAHKGYAVVSPANTARWVGCALAELMALLPH